MKNLKMIYSLLVVLVAGLFASCTADPYTPGEVPMGPQVCFSNENATVVEIAGKDGGDIHNVVLTRIVADEALDVYIIADAGEHASIFEIPEKVTFAAGEKVANFAITVNSAAMQEDDEYPVSMLLADEKQGTPYGESSWTVKFKLFPWTLVETQDAKLGKFRGGDAFSALYNIATALAEINVSIYEHNTRKGLYMVEDPWLSMIVPTLGIESEEAALEEGFKHTATNLVINCIDPTKCYIEQQNMGLTIAQGELMIASDYHPETNPTGVAGTLEDGVLTFPAGAILAGASKFEDGTMFESNLEGAFRLVWPGCIAVDYALTVDYLGFEISPDLQSVLAKFNFNYGDDVEGIKYYFAQGNVIADPASAIAALIDGSASNIVTIENFTKGSKQLTLNTTIENGGLYTIIAAPISKEGTLVEKYVSLDSFYYPGLGDIGSHPCEITVQVGNYTDYNTIEEGEEIANHNALGYNIKGSDLKTIYVGYWKSSEYNELIKKSTAKELLEKDFAPLLFEDVVAANSAEGKNGFCPGLSAETAYTVVVYAVNDYEESIVKTFEHTTAAAPAYSGDFGIGQYTWSYKDNNNEYTTTLNVQSYQGSLTQFLVSGLGYEDGSEWFAIYNAEKGTLTLSGEVRGRESEGNLFGVPFGNMDAETIYLYASIAKEGTGGKMNDPFVFTVDKETKKLNGSNNALTIYTQKGGKTSIYKKFDTSDKTTITHIEGGENQ